jgi:hypothetical protein
MKEFLEFWSGDFYSVTVSFFLAVIGFVVSLRRKQNYKLKPLIFFFLGYILLEIISSFVIGIQLHKPIRVKITIYSDFIDTIVEFLAFFFVIKNYVSNKQIGKAVKLLLPIFISLIITYFLYYKINYNGLDQYFLQTVFTIQASLLIVACILYYVDLFTKEPKLKLTEDPSFWVVTGVAFFMLSTLPFSIFAMYLVKINFQLYIRLFIVYEIFYWILFLMIIRAYFCKSAASR